MQAFHSQIPTSYLSRFLCVCDTSPQLFDPLEWSNPLTLPFFTTLLFLNILFTHLSFHGSHYNHILACTQLISSPTILFTR